MLASALLPNVDVWTAIPSDAVTDVVVPSPPEMRLSWTFGAPARADEHADAARCASRSGAAVDAGVHDDGGRGRLDPERDRAVARCRIPRPAPPLMMIVCEERARGPLHEDADRRGWSSDAALAIARPSIVLAAGTASPRRGGSLVCAAGVRVLDDRVVRVVERRVAEWRRARPGRRSRRRREGRPLRRGRGSVSTYVPALSRGPRRLRQAMRQRRSLRRAPPRATSSALPAKGRRSESSPSRLGDVDDRALGRGVERGGSRRQRAYRLAARRSALPRSALHRSSTSAAPPSCRRPLP